MAPIGIALIGGGIFIQEEHVPAVLACDLLVVKAVYSRSLKSAEATANLLSKSNSSVDLYSEDSGEGKSYQDILKRSDITAVIIGLPITSQPQYIKAALNAGKQVLSEKPTAESAASAKELIDWYRKVSAEKGCTWAVAENFRFTDKFIWAAAEAKKLGKVTGCFVKVFYMMAADNKYYEKSPWRVKPTHVGGYIIDAGVHYVAALRLLIGDETVEFVSGYSYTATQHLPPPDTIHGVFKLKSGVAGSFMSSCGTSYYGAEFNVSCENGSVTVTGDNVTVSSKDGNHNKEFQYSSGVTEEVKAWAESMAAGKPHPLQSPEESLADLEFLEVMLDTGAKDGSPRQLKYQQL